MSVQGLTSHSTDNRSFWRRVFPGNQLHWYWQPKNKETKHYIHRKHERETEKTTLANKTISALVWYDFYDLRRQETERILFLQPRGPHWAYLTRGIAGSLGAWAVIRFATLSSQILENGVCSSQPYCSHYLPVHKALAFQCKTNISGLPDRQMLLVKVHSENQRPRE